MARKSTPKKTPAATVGATFTTDGFANQASQDQARGILPPWPVPPAPVPGDWWAQAFAAWLRALAANGPIVIRLP